MSSERKPSPGDPEWIPYRLRPEWADVAPIPQDDGLDPVVRIAYPDHCKLSMCGSPT